MTPQNRHAEVPLPSWRADAARHTRVRTPASNWLVRTARVLLREPGRALLMLRMTGAYAAVSLLARVTSLPRAFEAMSPALRGVAPDEARVERTVDALNTLLEAGVPGIHPQCWRRAAVLRRFLRFEGVDTSIVFGIAPSTASAVEAHAWIERNGRPFAEAEDVSAYRRVFEFP